MANGLFKMALEMNKSEHGNPTPRLRALDESLRSGLSEHFSDTEIEAFCQFVDKGDFIKKLSQKAFMGSLQTSASGSTADYYRTENDKSAIAALGLMFVARREVIRDKLTAGEAAESLVGQSFEEEIKAKLLSMQKLFTIGWRSGGTGYVRENISPENERLLIDIFSVFAIKHSAHAYPYKEDKDGYRAIQLDKPDSIPLTGKLSFYDDNYSVIIQPEMIQSSRSRQLRK